MSDVAAHLKGELAYTTKGEKMNGEKTFGIVVRDYLLAQGGDYVTGIGNPNWSRFAEDIDGVHYETLRKAVAGERAPGVGLMESVASAMGQEPTIFFEYTVAKTRELFDPAVVGVEQAIENVNLFLEARAKKPRASRRKS